MSASIAKTPVKKPAPGQPALTARHPRIEDFPVIFDLIRTNAISLRSACARLGIHEPSVSQACNDDQSPGGLGDQYARAREARGDQLGERVILTADAILNPNPDPTKRISENAARIAIDAYKWAAARMDHKRWGDRVSQEISGPGGKELPPPIAPGVVYIFGLPDNGRDPVDPGMAHPDELPPAPPAE